jgi:hypothetical protein
MNGVAEHWLQIAPMDGKCKLLIKWKGGGLTILLTFRPDFARISFMTPPNLAGWSTIVTPAPSSALYLASAVPSPIPVQAPAWPITRPGAAWNPPTTAAIGLRRLAMLLRFSILLKNYFGSLTRLL